MNAVTCPNPDCGMKNHVEDALWEEMLSSSSTICLTCNRCDTRIPSPNQQSVIERLTMGHVSIGWGGHTIVEGPGGPYPEHVTPEDPSQIIKRLPFLLLDAQRVYSNNYLPPAHYTDLPIHLYGDCRDEVIDGKPYKAWYKRRITQRDDKTLCLELELAELVEIRHAAKMLYGDERYALISEMVAYDRQFKFVKRLPAFHPVSTTEFVKVTFDLI